jgi:hypothetical protein
MSENEIWQIKLPNGDVRSGTLEQLDEAFSQGAITETTLVRREGTDAWITLAEAAGIEAAPPTEPAAATAAPTMPPSAPPPAITTDVDLDVDAKALGASSKKSIAIVAGAAIAVLALAGVFVVRVSGDAEKNLPAAGAAPPPVAADLAHATTTTPADDTATPARTLTDEQKKALLQADQQRQDEARKKALSRPRPVQARPSKDPFHAGGSKYDPLNSSL